MLDETVKLFFSVIKISATSCFALFQALYYRLLLAEKFKSICLLKKGVDRNFFLPSSILIADHLD